MSSYDFKVVLLGQGCVGKTSLVLRYVSNVFNDSHQSTLQASFLKKQLYLDQDLVRLNIWDTAGQEKFHALGPIYYREAHGALLVYDVTSPDSLRKVRDWIKELNKMLGSHKVRLAIVGNKMDLIKDPASWPLIQEAVAMAEELLNARHYLTSAKSNEGIGEMFVSLAKRMIEQQTLGGGPAGRASGPPGPRLLQLGVGGRGEVQQAALAERGPAGSSSAHYGSLEACAQRSHCSCL